VEEELLLNISPLFLLSPPSLWTAGLRSSEDALFERGMLSLICSKLFKLINKEEKANGGLEENILGVKVLELAT